MLEIDANLPPGVLCDGADAALVRALDTTGALWWAGDERAFALDPATQAVTGWTDRLRNAILRPTEPNTGNALLGTMGGRAGLQCRRGLHCGLWAPDVVADAGTVTVGLRWRAAPDGASKTLLTLNTDGAARKHAGENYLFVSEADGRLTVKDDADLVTLDLPVPPISQTRMALVALSRSDLRVWILGGASGAARPRAPVLRGPASVFVACRNHRPGLVKTLGGALISDIWIVPDAALDEDAAGMTAFRRFHLWSGDR